MNKMFNLLRFEAGGEGGGGGASGGEGGGATLMNGGGSSGGEGGGAPPEWLASFKDEGLRTSKSLARFQGPEVLAKAYLESEKAISTRVALPTDKSTPEERSAFFNKLGRPETSDKYTIPKLDLPEGLPVSKDYQTKALSKMHELGLSDSQASALYGMHMEQAKTEFLAHKDTIAKTAASTEAELKKEWGGAYDSNMVLAFNTAKQFGGQEMIDWLNQTGAGVDPRVNRMFAKIGKALGEPASRTGGGDNSFEKPTQEVALEKVKAMMSDPATRAILGNMRDPKHAETKKVYAALMPIAYPGKEEIFG